MKLHFLIKFILLSMAFNLSACAYTTKIGDKLLPDSEYNTMVVKADSAMQNGEWSKAAIMYEKGFQLKPDAWSLKLKQATAYQNEGNLAQAFNTYQTIIDAKSTTTAVDDKVIKLAQIGQVKLGFKKEPIVVSSDEKVMITEAMKQESVATLSSKVAIAEEQLKKPDPIPVQKITSEQLSQAGQEPVVQPPVIDQSKEVMAEVSAWAEAWAAKKVDAYFSHYVDGFSGDMTDANAWRKSRKTKIANSQQIKISFSDIKIRNNSNESVDVFFTQEYQSGSYKDSGRKVLSLKKINGRWLISQETFK